MSFFGRSLIKLEFTLGLISNDSGGTSNRTSLSKKAEIFNANFPQFLVETFPVTFSATSF